MERGPEARMHFVCLIKACSVPLVCLIKAEKRLFADMIVDHESRSQCLSVAVSLSDRFLLVGVRLR